MKKMITVLALLCAVLLPFTAMAEAALTWEEVEPMMEELGLQGEFVALEELGLAIWVPDGMEFVEVPEKDAAEGRLYLIADDDCYLAVDALNVEGLTLEQAYDNAVSSGMAEPELGTVNGLPVLTYTDMGNNIGVMALVDTNSNLILFSFGPFDSDAAALGFTVICGSLMPLE